ARKLQSNDAGERAEAARKLNDLAHKAGDPKTQQAAADALKNQNQDQGENTEVKDLAQKLQSQDPAERAEAAKKLNDLAQNAGDPKTQQAAADALKKAADAQNQSEQGSQEGTNSTPGRNNPAEQTNTKGQAQGSEKSNPPSSPEKTANHSPGQPGKGSSNQGQSPQPVEGKNSSSNNPGHNQETGSQTSPNKSAQDNPMKEKTDQVGNGPGQGLRGNREHPIPGGGPGRQAAAGTGPDATFQKKAGNLQIEELDKKLTPDMLRKLNWTEEEKQEFLQGLRRKAAAEAAQQPEKLADPRRPGGPLGNLGPHSVQSGQGQEDNVRYTGPALPPPGFREAQKEFTQNLSKQEKSGP
ncbi:MAG: hypothetical protein JO112_15840, partial [Planctomycetes bacterium]|nr:hypothetical protein [Planctomycetota bacterium]